MSLSPITRTEHTVDEEQIILDEEFLCKVC